MIIMRVNNGFEMKNLVKPIKLMRSCSHYYICLVESSTRAYENILLFFFPISSSSVAPHRHLHNISLNLTVSITMRIYLSSLLSLALSRFFSLSCSLSLRVGSLRTCCSCMILYRHDGS